MESLEFLLPSSSMEHRASATLCGVVSSGNLEILIQTQPDTHHCMVQIQTSARGFGTVWQAVLEQFVAGHATGGLLVRIHDMGATPAVVSLRLRQALAEFGEKNDENS